MSRAPARKMGALIFVLSASTTACSSFPSASFTSATQNFSPACDRAKSLAIRAARLRSCASAAFVCRFSHSRISASIFSKCAARASICCSILSISASLSKAGSTAMLGFLRARASNCSCCRAASCFAQLRAASPPTASMRLVPAAIASSLTIRKGPISPVDLTCVPPHNSIE